MKGIVSFYEKLDCSEDAKIKEVLKKSGFVIQSINILEKKWNEESLLKFFQGKTIHECVDNCAPEVLKREIRPETLAEYELLSLMISNPILIQRPLIFFRGEFGVGPKSSLLKKLLGDDFGNFLEDKKESCH